MAKTKKKTKSRQSTTHVKHKSINKAAGKSNISFSRYIYAVLKQIHSNLGISQKSITIMNSFVHDIFERIANEGSSLVRLDNRKTMTEWDIQSAVRLVIKGGELTKHAIHEGTKAVVTINVGQGLNVTRDSLMNMSFNRSVF